MLITPRHVNAWKSSQELLAKALDKPHIAEFERPTYLHQNDSACIRLLYPADKCDGSVC